MPPRRPQYFTHQCFDVAGMLQPARLWYPPDTCACFCIAASGTRATGKVASQPGGGKRGWIVGWGFRAVRKHCTALWRPWAGETVYKVTHRDHEGNSFALENGRHILIKGRSNSHRPRLAGYFVWRIWSASPGKASQALCTDRKGDPLEAAGR